MKFCPQCATPLQEILIDGEIRNGCAAGDCNFVHWNNPTPVVAGIVEREEGKLVLAHNVAWPAGFHSVITGFLEAAEDPMEGIARETKEELNLTALSSELIGLYPFAQMNQLIIAYHIKAVGEIKLNHELDGFIEIPFAEVKTWPGGTGAALYDFLTARGIQPERAF